MMLRGRTEQGPLWSLDFIPKARYLNGGATQSDSWGRGITWAAV